MSRCFFVLLIYLLSPSHQQDQQRQQRQRQQQHHPHHEPQQDLSPRTIHIHLINHAEHVEVYWIHPIHGQGHLHQRLAPYDIARITSFPGHEFELRDASCFVGTCRRAVLRVPTENMVAKLQKDWTILITSDSPSEGIQRCRDNVRKQESTQATINATLECIRPFLEYKFQQSHERKVSLAEALHRIAYSLENYTCANESLGTTPYLHTERWKYGSQNYHVQVHHQQSTSQVHVIDNFLSPQECSLLTTAAELHYSTATARGSVHYARQAQHAAIDTPWEQSTHPVTELSHRIYAYANQVLHLNLSHHGQEMLTAIRYHVNDKYMPHCDARGACGGTQHDHGERVATMILYCQLPSQGGATNFQRLNIHVRPKLYQALFFSYMDPLTQAMDPGMTLHSGCPVLEGTKIIVTQWFRLGVSKEWNFTNVNDLPLDVL